MPTRESLPISHLETSVMSILENPDESLDNKAAWLEGFFRTPITKKRDYLKRWEIFLGKDVGGILSPSQTEVIVEKFRELHNANDKNEGERAGHNTLTNYLYSDLFLPVLTSIHDYAKENNDLNALRQSSFAILVLNDALDILQTPNPQELREFDQGNLTQISSTKSTDTIMQPFDKNVTVNLAEVLPSLHLDSMSGNNTDLQNFYSLMNLSRLTAFQCIKANHYKSITLDREKVKLPKDFEIKDFADLSNKAEQHFLELQEGIVFPEDILTKINHSKALVLSIDWNSVWNIRESYANSHIIALTTETIKKLSNDFRKKFPDKEIFFVMNTGRPADYAWGVIEALSVVKELRIIGLAESGGVILKPEMTKGETEVAVENSKQWEAQLRALRRHLLSKVENHLDVHIEPKKSMLSIKLAEKDVTGGPWLHQTLDGKPFSPEWIAQETKNFLTQKKSDLSAERENLQSILNSDDQLGGKVIEALTILNGDQTKLSQEEKKRIYEIFKKEKDHRINRMLTLTEELQTINLMSEKLEPVYNSRAGYVDIGHRDFNKYSTLIKQIENQCGCNHHEVTVISIGDSQTDITPEINTGDKEVNRGANEAMLVAVGNASPALREAVERRRQKNNRGIQTVTPSILGLISIIRGLDRLINS